MFRQDATLLQDSGYDDKTRLSASGNKENSSPNKKARKSLASNWSTQHDGSTIFLSGANSDNHQRRHSGGVRVHSDSSFSNPETPSKSLLGATSDSSLLFSPPSILRDTLSASSGLVQRVDSSSESPSSSAADLAYGYEMKGESLPNAVGGGPSASNDTKSGPLDDNHPNSSPKSKVSRFVSLGYHVVLTSYSQLDVRWNMIACGKTRPTLDLTEQARQFIHHNHMKPRSLDL